MLFLVHLCQHFVYWKKWETRLCFKKNFPGIGGGGGGGTFVNFCWVCAAGLPEPLPHYSIFLGPNIDPILVTFGKM